MVFQNGVGEWMHACFGPDISCDRTERMFRFGEEALELMQSLDCTEDEAIALVRYVFSRKKGEPRQEIGGVMTTLAALCNAMPMRTSMDECGAAELTRCWQNIERIRAKHAAKPIGIRTALPGMIAPSEAESGG